MHATPFNPLKLVLHVVLGSTILLLIASPLLAWGQPNQSMPLSGEAFLYAHYLGEQAKPFPFLVIGQTRGQTPQTLEQMLRLNSATARLYRVPGSKFSQIWQALVHEYAWTEPISPPIGNDLYEIVLWDRSPRQLLLGRQQMRTFLEHLLQLTDSSSPNLSEELKALMRRLSN